MHDQSHRCGARERVELRATVTRAGGGRREGGAIGMRSLAVGCVHQPSGVTRLLGGAHSAGIVCALPPAIHHSHTHCGHPAVACRRAGAWAEAWGAP